MHTAIKYMGFWSIMKVESVQYLQPRNCMLPTFHPNNSLSSEDHQIILILPKGLCSSHYTLAKATIFYGVCGRRWRQREYFFLWQRFHSIVKRHTFWKGHIRLSRAEPSTRICCHLLWTEFWNSCGVVRALEVHYCHRSVAGSTFAQCRGRMRNKGSVSRNSLIEVVLSILK